jgi:hypothetical protein
MKREKLLPSLVQLILISILVVGVISYISTEKRLIGPILIALGFIPWIPLRVAGRSIRSAGADIIFGSIDTGLLAVAALIGANFGGILGAIVGGVVGDSITDGLAGLFEGKVSSFLRHRGIDEARTPLSSSMGKMSGCLIGAGITLTVAWSIIR